MGFEVALFNTRKRRYQTRLINCNCNERRTQFDLSMSINYKIYQGYYYQITEALKNILALKNLMVLGGKSKHSTQKSLGWRPNPAGLESGIRNAGDVMYMRTSITHIYCYTRGCKRRSIHTKQWGGIILSFNILYVHLFQYLYYILLPIASFYGVFNMKI